MDRDAIMILRGDRRKTRWKRFRPVYEGRVEEGLPGSHSTGEEFRWVESQSSTIVPSEKTGVLANGSTLRGRKRVQIGHYGEPITSATNHHSQSKWKEGVLGLLLYCIFTRVTDTQIGKVSFGIVCLSKATLFLSILCFTVCDFLFLYVSYSFSKLR